MVFALSTTLCQSCRNELMRLTSIMTVSPIIRPRLESIITAEPRESSSSRVSEICLTNDDLIIFSCYILSSIRDLTVRILLLAYDFRSMLLSKDFITNARVYH